MALRAERLPVQSDEDSKGGEAYLACGGALLVKFVRNDILRVFNVTDNCGRGNNCRDFMSYLDAGRGYNAVVVNSGAHYVEDSAYVAAMTTVADAVSERMKEAHPDSSFMLFRNTVPGSPDCDSFALSAPLELEEAERRVASYTKWYHWQDNKRQNELVEPIFAARGFLLLDAYTPTVRRFDSHQGGDCLHYCESLPASRRVPPFLFAITPCCLPCLPPSAPYKIRALHFLCASST
ncbi:unnamed protein product [Phaeothamnion confervicola]